MRPSFLSFLDPLVTSKILRYTKAPDSNRGDYWWLLVIAHFCNLDKLCMLWSVAGASTLKVWQLWEHHWIWKNFSWTNSWSLREKNLDMSWQSDAVAAFLPAHNWIFSWIRGTMEDKQKFNGKPKCRRPCTLFLHVHDSTFEFLQTSLAAVKTMSKEEPFICFVEIFWLHLATLITRPPSHSCWLLALWLPNHPSVRQVVDCDIVWHVCWSVVVSFVLRWYRDV